MQLAVTGTIKKTRMRVQYPVLVKAQFALFVANSFSDLLLSSSFRDLSKELGVDNWEIN